jgi:hypothetical protein
MRLFVLAFPLLLASLIGCEWLRENAYSNADSCQSSPPVCGGRDDDPGCRMGDGRTEREIECRR